jgi:hypothetical protein
MKPLDLTSDPISAAVHRRPREERRVVWIHIDIPGVLATDEHPGLPAVNRWCVLREADHVPSTHADQRITTLCSTTLRYAPLNVSTRRPLNTCPACETELAAGTPGAAVAIGLDDLAIPSATPEPATARVATANLRGKRPASDPPEAWESAAWDPDSREHTGGGQ